MSQTQARQAPLFDEPEAPAGARVAPADPGEGVRALAVELHSRWGDGLKLGTSSWHFPGWAGSVWQGSPAEANLSRHGLSAYAQHPLLRCVGLDRSFYRALDAATYTALAAQVGSDFRFVVKAPAMVSDAVQRDPANGAALQPNPLFLDPAVALTAAVQPAVQGLGERLGVLVFQLSPLPSVWLRDPAALHRRLAKLFDAVVPALPGSALAALEVRDAVLLTPELAAVLRHHGVRYCLGLHDRLPGIDAQLPMLRATWPGDLVCRWILQRGQRYAQARDRWTPFDRMQSPDLPTRMVLARVLAATLGAGHRAFVTINNKAEGSAPQSVVALAQALTSRS